MEAGVGTLLRLQPGQADVVLVVAEPSAKAIEVARRAAEIASDRSRVLVVANKIRDDDDLEVVRRALGEHELTVVADDDVIRRADEEGLAPIDVNAGSTRVQALVALAGRLQPPAASG